MIVARYSMAALMFFLAGCSSQPEVTGTSGSWQQHSAKIAELNQWQVQGKLGFKSESQGGSANLNWLQTNSSTSFPSAAPLVLVVPLLAATRLVRSFTQIIKRISTYPNSWH